MKEVGIFIFLEGNTDLRFFDAVLRPYFEEKYLDIRFQLYAGKTKLKINNLLKSIHSMKYDYIVFSDLDENNCSTIKKEKLIHEKGDFESGNIIIVKKMIESWYIAGIDKKNFKRIKNSYITLSESIDKNKFLEIFSRYYKYKIDVLQEILKSYSISQGRKNNTSLDYLFNKFIQS